MVNLQVSANGIGEVVAQIGRLADASATAGGATLEVFLPVPWAEGLETGYRRSGRLARRAGGAYMMQRGGEAGLRGIEGEIAAALPGGPSAVTQAYLAAGRRTVTAVQQLTPRRTGYTASQVTMRLTIGGRG